VIGEGPKGAAAKKVRAEEGGTIEEAAPEEEEGERQLGKVKVQRDHLKARDGWLRAFRLRKLTVYSLTMRRKALLLLRPAPGVKSMTQPFLLESNPHADRP